MTLEKIISPVARTFFLKKFFWIFKKILIHSFLFIYIGHHLMNFLVKYDNYKKFNKHVELEMLLKIGGGIKISWKKDSKSGLQNFFGPILRFFTKNQSSELMIPAFHDYSLEPKMTKCGDLLYFKILFVTFISCKTFNEFDNIKSIDFPFW